MSRYLTPSRIGLLTLISLYTESVVPSKAIVPVLSFLVSHAIPISSPLSCSEVELQPRNAVLVIEEFQKTTICHASGIPGRTVWDLLLHKLWKIDSFDALQLFLDTLSLLLQKTPEEKQKNAEDDAGPIPNRMLLSRVSPLGSFIRRAQVEFTRLPFHESVNLWKAFVSYRAPTLSQFKKRNPSAGNMSFDSNLLEGRLAWGDPLTKVIYGELQREAQQEASMSTEDVEKLLEYQIDQMQSKVAPNDLVCRPYTNLMHRNGQSNSAPHEGEVSRHARGWRYGTQLIPLC